jgi:cyclopropane fatty-acyl-phospholipid synthase-like methyltransferase
MTGSTDKPFAPSCERNRDPILHILREVFADRKRVLEIGGGTGQHAVHFAEALAHLTWQTSEQAEHLAGIRRWLDEAGLPNTPPPIALDVNQPEWPVMRFDALFTANTLHIMAWPEVEALFAHLPEVMSEDAKLVVYGPFNIDGRYTSESNAAFDTWLHERGDHMGIRDLADVDALASSARLRRIADHALPANNRCVAWQRRSD